jgi:cytochrome b
MEENAAVPQRSENLKAVPTSWRQPIKETAMNEPSAIRARPGTGETAAGKVLVWDLPVRVFHWLLALSFAGAYITAESERWRLLHVTLGYTVAGLVCFRILWGLVGTRTARFANFVRGPRAVARYLGAILRGKPEHYTGHNPAGALAIVSMLGLSLAVGLSGWAVYTERGGDWLEEAHEVAANLMLAVVIIHIVGVIAGSWLHRENLVRAMFTGRKLGSPQEAIRKTWRSIAALILAAVLAFWWFQWRNAPAGSGWSGKAATSDQRADDD